MWGDGDVQEWIGPYASGEVATFSHTFSTKGTYTISARARDIYNAYSGWGVLDVTMPRSRILNNFIINKILEFFQRILSL